MTNKRNSSFWPSYVDIMTTLFAIMLVLFVVTYSRFKITEQKNAALYAEAKIKEKLFDEIQMVNATIAEIDATAYFGYDERYLKHLFTIAVEYQVKQYDVENGLKLDLTNPTEAARIRARIIEAGQIIKQTIEKLKDKDYQNNNIKFLVVIEGQSSKLRFETDDWQNNYTLSYLRAQFLNRFWIDHGIDIAAIPRCELIISGSGEGGVPRDDNDVRNQRFLIHIVPVIGNYETPVVPF